MPLTIPNLGAASYAAQARPDAVDVDILVAGNAGDGVVNAGTHLCAVTAQGTPDMTVAVDSGAIKSGGAPKAVAAGNVTIAVADATNPRIDLIVVDSAGAKQRRAGTAAANPLLPLLTAGDVALAAIYVPANATNIATAQILDKRVLVPRGLGAQTTRVNRTAGDLSLNNTSWTVVNSGLDITLAAVVGDVIEVGASGFTGAEAILIFFDVFSLVGATLTNSWADDAALNNTHQGIMAWRCEASAVGKFGPPITRAVVAGDISGGNVTLRLCFRTNTAGAKSLLAGTVAGTPFSFWARNLGQ